MDENIVFMFYSKSADKPPGYGSGEKMVESKKQEYSQLGQIKDWRKMLSNFWIAEFDLDGHRWSSVEHYYQGSKFKKENPEYYLQFSLDSGSELSKDAGMAKGAGGKTGKVDGKIFRPKNVKIDADFFTNGHDNKEMYDAQFAKFTQNVDLLRVLLLTKDAKLMHFSRGSPPVFFENLVNIRNVLKKENPVIPEVVNEQPKKIRIRTTKKKSPKEVPTDTIEPKETIEPKKVRKPRTYKAKKVEEVPTEPLLGEPTPKQVRKPRTYKAKKTEEVPIENVQVEEPLVLPPKTRKPRTKKAQEPQSTNAKANPKKTLAQMRRDFPQDIIVTVGTTTKCPKGTRKNKDGCILTKEFKDTFLKRKLCIQNKRDNL
jgi:hypothetical protein